MGDSVDAENAESAGDAPVFHLTDKDKEILAMRDEDYTLHSWEDLKDLICISYHQYIVSIYKG